MGTYAKELEGQLGEVQKFMERLVCRRKELGSSLAELGLTLITFGNHEQKTSEPDAAATCKALQDLGSCCDHLAISVHQQAAEEARKALLVCRPCDLAVLRAFCTLWLVTLTIMAIPGCRGVASNRAGS
jgi:hypothetical protein